MKPKKEDTYSYKVWLQSDKIYKRALAVLGHDMLGVLIVYGLIIVTVLAGAIVFGLGGWIIEAIF